MLLLPPAWPLHPDPEPSSTSNIHSSPQSDISCCPRPSLSDRETSRLRPTAPDEIPVCRSPQAFPAPDSSPDPVHFGRENIALRCSPLCPPAPGPIPTVTGCGTSLPSLDSPASALCRPRPGAARQCPASNQRCTIRVRQWYSPPLRPSPPARPTPNVPEVHCVSEESLAKHRPALVAQALPPTASRFLLIADSFPPTASLLLEGCVAP